MIKNIKQFIKTVLLKFGILHPARGIKISASAKADIVLNEKRPEIGIFVETGTEFGVMIEKVGQYFRKIYSIELDNGLYEQAKEKFRNEDKLTLINGDSGIEIKKILNEVHEPTLFWLDAHGPGPMTVRNHQHCPLQSELEEIVKHTCKKHVIIIDDARHFDRYSISVIKSLALQGGYSFSIKSGLFILK